MFFSSYMGHQSALVIIQQSLHAGSIFITFLVHNYYKQQFYDVIFHEHISRNKTHKKYFKEFSFKYKHFCSYLSSIVLLIQLLIINKTLLLLQYWHIN